jgi:radical SAM-linked protein
VKGDLGTALRLGYAKQGKVRFISHRDVARAFERAFRVGQWPLAFTEGFSPHPKVSFGLALSTGYEGDTEYLDVELAVDDPDEGELGDLLAVLEPSLPAGLAVWGAAVLAPRTTSLQEAVTAVEYLVDVELESDGTLGDGDGPLGDGGSVEPGARRLDRACEQVLAAETLVGVRRRKGREVEDDLRPAILELEAVSDRTLRLVTATQPRGARPREILAVLGDGLTESRVRRTHQWIERDGSRCEPLDELGARRVHVLAARTVVGARAS